MLALGILSLAAGFFLIPLGIVSWFMGSRDLKRMNLGQVDPAGRSLTQIGKIFGISSMCIWLLSAGCTFLMLLGTASGSTEKYSTGDGTRTVTKRFPQIAGDHEMSRKELEYHEVERPNGSWVKEGRFTHWSWTGETLAEGSYRDGKREGEWTFRNEDCSMDLTRSGIYENDVRVQEGARPAGY